MFLNYSTSAAPTAQSFSATDSLSSNSNSSLDEKGSKKSKDIKTCAQPTERGAPVSIPDSYLCPILQGIMHDPVVAADAQTYERIAITDWLQRGNRVSPVTLEQLAHTNLIPNVRLKATIQEFEVKLPAIQRENQIRTDYKMSVALREKFVENLVERRKLKEEEETKKVSVLDVQLKAEQLRNQAFQSQMQQMQEQMRQLQEEMKKMKLENLASDSSSINSSSFSPVASSSSASAFASSSSSFFYAPAANTPTSAISSINSSYSAPSCSCSSFFEDKKQENTRISIVELKALAEKGDTHAQAMLGRAYFWGEGIEKNRNEASRWFQLAAQKTNVPAGQYAKGRCYSEGFGVAKDEQEAASWYRRAAEQGFALAQNNLGVCYQKGLAKNAKEAVSWYRKAAVQGNAPAQYNLGICCQNGIGVAKDEKEAFSWYRRAAEQGDAIAQNSLGYCYYTGTMVTKDQKAAVSWFRRAAEQGFAHAQCNLGYCYEYGTGINKDSNEAVRYYTLAASQQHQEAQAALARLKSAQGCVIT